MTDNTREKLIAAVRELALARKRSKDMEFAKRARYKDMMETSQGVLYTQAESDAKAAKDRVKETDSNARGWAESLYRQDGNKSPVPGVGIRDMKRYEYDEEEAIRWCETNAPVCIKKVLDRKAYESVRPDLEPVETPQIRIASDLSEYEADE